MIKLLPRFTTTIISPHQEKPPPHSIKSTEFPTPLTRTWNAANLQQITLNLSTTNDVNMPGNAKRSRTVSQRSNPAFSWHALDPVKWCNLYSVRWLSSPALDLALNQIGRPWLMTRRHSNALQRVPAYGYQNWMAVDPEHEEADDDEVVSTAGARPETEFGAKGQLRTWPTQ